MKALPTASSNALTLATTPGASPLTAQAKAQRLRTHAQEKRGGTGDGFKDHLRAKQKGGPHGDHAKPSDHVSDTPAETATERSTKPSAESQNAAEGRPQAKTPTTQMQQCDETSAENPQDATQVAEQAAKDASEPFLQEVVAQVLQGVDPALKMKLASLARAAGTVSGNAAAAMRSGVTDSAGADGAEPSASLVNVEGFAAHSQSAPPAEPAAHASTPDRPAQMQPENKAPSAKATPTDPSGDGTQPGPASSLEHATAAVSEAATAINPALTPVRGGEQRITLSPTLTAVAPATSANGQAVPQTVAEKAASTPPPPPPLAQQVQHGLEVAMHDLPAPAGDRLVTLKLNPSALGSLRIALHVSGDAVQVRFQVGSAKAKASIGKSMEDLKAAIGRQGLRVESMEVEEDRALAAPTGPSLDENGQGNTAGVPATGQADTGKGFAQLLDAPHGPDGPSFADAPGRTPNQGDAEHEGGVLQVLTFRLDAVG